MNHKIYKFILYIGSIITTSTKPEAWIDTIHNFSSEPISITFITDQWKKDSESIIIKPNESTSIQKNLFTTLAIKTELGLFFYHWNYENFCMETAFLPTTEEIIKPERFNLLYQSKSCPTYYWQETILIIIPKQNRNFETIYGQSPNLLIKKNKYLGRRYYVNDWINQMRRLFFHDLPIKEKIGYYCDYTPHKRRELEKKHNFHFFE